MCTRHTTLIAFWLSILLPLFGSTAAQSQPPEVTVPDAPADQAAAPRINRTPLDTFYLIDDNGELVPYFNMPFEEFDEVYQLYLKYKTMQAPVEPLRYAVQNLTVQGSAEGQRALLDVRVTISTRVDGWTRVPLGLNDLVMREMVKDEDRKWFLEYDQQDSGYVCWIQGKANETHVIAFKAIANVHVAGGQSVLALNAPSATFSELRIRVPARSIEAEPSRGATLQQVVLTEDDHAELSVLGLGRGFSIAWREKRPSDEMAPPLHVSGNILVRVVEQDLLQADAHLSVQSIGAPFDSFVVQLPQGMQLEPARQPGYSVRLLPPDRDEAGNESPSAQLVEVTVDGPPVGQQEVRLKAQLRREAIPSAGIELGGFEVLGAQFQSGYFNLAMSDDWKLSWTEGANTRRVESISDPLRREGVVARFAYERQPCSLVIRFSPQEKSVTVQPHYIINVEEDRVQLELKLRCEFNGTRIDRLRLAIGDWQVQEQTVEPQLVDKLEQGDELVVHLSPMAQLKSDPVEITILAHQAVDDEAKQAGKWIAELPRPLASKSTQATVAVMSPNNVLLTPLSDQTQGLVLQPSAEATLLAEEPDSVLFYRAQGESVPLILATRLSIREGSVSANVAVNLGIERELLLVTQRVEFQIDYEPLTHLQLDLPLSAIKSPDFRLSLDGDLLPVESRREVPGTRDSTRWRRFEVDLTGTGLGSYELMVEYSLPLPESAKSLQSNDGQSVPLSMEMVRPALMDVNNLTCEGLYLQANKAFVLEPIKLDWILQAEERWELDQPRSYRLLGTVPDKIDLIVRAHDTASRRSTVIKQTWLQSWLTSNRRQERVVFRFRSSEEQVQVDLPLGARFEELALDGQPVQATPVEGEPLTIRLGDVQGKGEHILELWYHYDLPSEIAPGWKDVSVPQLLGAHWTRVFYWQLVLPSEHQLVSAPAMMIPELKWVWQGLFWGRRASLDQRELERRTAASVQRDLPHATNQYVFSSLGQVETIQFSTIHRRNVILMTSISAFIGGILLIHVPLLRHPAALLLLGVAVLAGGWLYPEPALQVAQLACFGLVFVLVSQLLKWMLGRRHERRVLVRGTSRAGVDSTETLISPAELVSQGSTTSGSLVIHTGDSESGKRG